MPNSYRIRTQLGLNKTIPVKLDQDFDTLEILSLAVYPQNVYTRSCADYGVVCGRVFANKGYGIVNARVSIFIPLQTEDESNPLVSTLYPYKSFLDFNEDGYKYNLLPYSQSHSGHVPVGTFPDRIDALTNPTVVEVYDKYYKFTAKTNDAGDFMIFGVPVGQYDIFMQVDLSDIGEFSLTPQDLIRMGRATEAQVNGTKFKFSENYSELPQIITLEKVIQVAPFFGQEGICQHFITRTDFDLTSEGGIDFRPTAVFMGSMFSSTDKKKLKKRCRVPAKQGWLCDLITGPGQIETIRHRVGTDELGRPLLENFKLENDGKLIDENGTWLVELPMNLDYVYTDENGVRRVSPDGSVGVPTRGRYRFKIKWQQSPSLREETKRAYFLVPNIKEYGWNDTNMNNPDDDPGSEQSFYNIPNLPLPLPFVAPEEGEQPSPGPFVIDLVGSTSNYYNVTNTNNLDSYTVLVDGVERPDYYTTIPMPLLTSNLVSIRYTLIDPTQNGSLFVNILNTSQFLQQSSYAFSLNWTDYGDSIMIDEAVNCEDRFYEFQYNKVYTVSQLIDRYTNRFFPQKSTQIKHILDDNCEGEYNTFPVNDVYYRYNLLFIVTNVLLTIIKFSFFQILIFLHVLAFLWPIFAVIVFLIWLIQKFLFWVCETLNKIRRHDKECTEPQELSDLLKNPFKNVRLPLFLYTEDGCERCRCRVVDQELDEESNTLLFQLNQNVEQLEEGNISYLADLNTRSSYGYWYQATGAFTNMGIYANPGGPGNPISSITDSELYDDAIGAVVVGNSGADPLIRKIPFWRGSFDDDNVDLFSTTLTPAERLNLFNTKAKYFDYTTLSFGDQNTPSPGNIGWNQIKVTINPDENDSSNVYHFDNLIVVLVDSTAFTRGDVITFQDPSLSPDANYNNTLLNNGNFSGTSGIKKYPESVTLKFANPDLTSDSPMLTTTYNMSGAYGGSIENQLQFANGDRPGNTCYPTDIEYFQVIDIREYHEYLCLTSKGDPYCSAAGSVSIGNFDDKRFSLPWRFLRSDRQFTEPSWNLSSNWFNAALVSRTVNNGEPSCFQACFNETTHNATFINSWASFTWDEATWAPKTNIRIMFLQRGVDVNSPYVEQEIDLRRFYGDDSDYDDNPIINGQNISPHCIVTGRFKLNQPILPGGYNTNGFDVFQTCGWRMNGIIRSYNINQEPIVTSDYQFLAVLGQTVTQTNGPDIDQLSPLVKSTDFFIDDNGIFDENTRILTPQETSEYSITVFLRFSGSFFQNGGLQVVLRDYTTATNVVLDTFDTLALNLVQGPYNNYIVDLIEGHEYRLLVENLLDGGDITYYADESEWVTGNPNGLILPRHNEIQSNEGNEIYFPSKFFEYGPNYISYDTTMPNYYSALDSNTIYRGWVLGERWRPQAFYDLSYGINDFGFTRIQGGAIDNVPGDPIGAGDSTTFSNIFAFSLGRDRGTDGQQFIPCSHSSIGQGNGGGRNSRVCGDAIIDPEAGGQSEVCEECDRYDSENQRTACPGCCRNRENLRASLLTYHAMSSNRRRNNVGGYWGMEYVEGGSAFANTMSYNSDLYQRLYSDTPNCTYEDPDGQPRQWGPLFPGDDEPEGYQYYGGGNCEYTNRPCENPDGTSRATRNRNWYWTNVQYISPVYAVFPDDVPPPTPPGGTEIPENFWYVNPNHYVTMSNRYNIVMRSDRLPSSTNVQTDGNGNGYLLHQNGGFSIFIVNSDCSFEEAGGGDLPTPEVSVDLDLSTLPGGLDGPIANVAASVTNCFDAVDLNSYYTYTDEATGNEYPAIYEEDPYSREDANIGSDWLWFVRGTGCYNIVSKPLASLFFHDIEGDPDNKRYSDIATVVEWIQRLKLTFSLCLDVYSHTFSNNWINGTLYAFSFQNATTFNSQNQPIRRFCRDTIYFHDPLNTYYYRSSPWDGTNFIGRPRYSPDANPETRRGNIRNLLFPTTILDMGPKAAFIQELVYSDEYDGYIVPRVPTTTYQDVTDILNLFVLSRLVNTSFIQQLFPLPDASGNEQGGDDPSVGAFFKNSRWQNGTLFASGLLPGLVDADYSQIISINSEFGINEFSPENYGNNDIIFAEDVIPPTYPYFGIFMSGDNQLRDYISPRRTIWNQNATLPIGASAFTEIPIKTQIVPFYQWYVYHNNDAPPSLFGTQSNNFITEFVTGVYTNSTTFPDGFFAHGYQSLDRLGGSSEYFTPEVNNTFYYKGYLINYSSGTDANGVTSYVAVNRRPSDARLRYTFGAPFHFYFGLIQGSSAMDRFMTKYTDTTIVYE